MAYLYTRKNGRSEIREARSTPRGPRSYTLASFSGPLTAEHLDRAESAARRPFHRAAIIARAHELGVVVTRRSADAPAHELLARLRMDAALDPRLATLLREQLSKLPAEPISDELSDVVEWVGASDAERGRALRDVLRLYDTIARSREPVREAKAEQFPRFEVRAERQAS